ARTQAMLCSATTSDSTARIAELRVRRQATRPAVGQPTVRERDRPGRCRPAARAAEHVMREWLVEIQTTRPAVEFGERRHAAQRCAGLAADHEALQVPRDVLPKFGQPAFLPEPLGEK